MVLAPMTLFAVGTVSQVLNDIRGTNSMTLTLTWIADSVLATVPSTAIDSTIMAKIEGLYIIAVETDPGSPAPAPNYDIVINDANGLDIMGGTLANRSATATEKVVPKVDTANSIYGPVMIPPNLDFIISNITTMSATGQVIWQISR